jgi:hypothetical protein
MKKYLLAAGRFLIKTKVINFLINGRELKPNVPYSILPTN